MRSSVVGRRVRVEEAVPTFFEHVRRALGERVELKGCAGRACREV
jgi:hypothetical protein